MRLAAVCCAWVLALTLPCPTLEVECGHRGGQHKAAGDETRRHRGAGRGMHDALLVLRLRGGATSRGNKRSWGEEVATPHDGSRSRGEVVFPRDCSSLHEALLRCTAAVSAHENADADASNSKRGRCDPPAAKHTGPPCVQEECSAHLLSAAEQDAGCDKRLFVQFGHHEFGDDTLLVNARGTWSVRGIGDLSGAVDLLQLQALAASWPGGGASNETAAPQASGGAKVQIVGVPSGRGASVAEARDDSTWHEGRVMDIALPNVSWPQLPPDRYNEAQILQQLRVYHTPVNTSHTTRAAPATASSAHQHAQAEQLRQNHERVLASSRAPTPSSTASWQRPTKIRPHKQIKSNPFEMLLEAPSETEVAGRWRFGETTRGTLRELACLDPFDPPPRLTALIEIHGGPWEVDHCRLQSNGGVIMRLLSNASARCTHSVLEGLDSRDKRAKMCVSAEQRSKWQGRWCVLQDAFVLVRLQHNGDVVCINSSLQYADTAVTLNDDSRVTMKATSIRRMRLGALCAFGNTQPASSLDMHQCYGADTKEWVTERRPGHYTHDANSFDQNDWSVNELRVASAECMLSPIYLRGLLKERTYKEKFATCDQLNRGAQVRNDNRRLMSSNLNRHHAWLFRRRYSRHYLVYLGPRAKEAAADEEGKEQDGEAVRVAMCALASGNLSACPELCVKEIDSEEDLYADDYAFMTRAHGQPVPLTLQMTDAKCLSDVPVEEIVVQKWAHTDDMDPDTWAVPPLMGEFNETDGYQPPTELDGYPVDHLPVIFRRLPLHRAINVPLREFEFTSRRSYSPPPVPPTHHQSTANLSSPPPMQTSEEGSQNVSRTNAHLAYTQDVAAEAEGERDTGHVKHPPNTLTHAQAKSPFRARPASPYIRVLHDDGSLALGSAEPLVHGHEQSSSEDDEEEDDDNDDDDDDDDGSRGRKRKQRKEGSLAVPARLARALMLRTQHDTGHPLSRPQDSAQDHEHHLRTRADADNAETRQDILENAAEQAKGLIKAETEAAEADRKRSWTHRHQGVRGVEHADFQGQVRPAWLGKLGGEDYGDEDFVDPAVMHAENGAASHKEPEEAQDGGAVVPYDLFHQASLLTTRKQNDEDEWESGGHLLQQPRGQGKSMLSEQDCNAYNASPRRRQAQQNQDTDDSSLPSIPPWEQDEEEEQDDSGSEERRQRYFARDGPQTKGELYLQYALT